MDERVKKLAKILVHYSVKAKPNETVLIRGNDLAKPLVLSVYEEVLKAGAHPRFSLGFDEANEIFYEEAKEVQLNHFPEIAYFEAKNIDCLIAIHSPLNVRALSRIEPKRLVLRQKVLKPINEWITSKVRWVVVNYPTPALAQEAEMSLSQYEDFVYKACLLDWEKKVREMRRIARLLEKGDEFLVKGKETELKLRIKGRRFIIGKGDYNLPDGEVFTGRIENSAEGRIYFEYPAIHNGREVSGVRLWFKNGKVVKASAEKNQGYLESMIGSDEGSRRLGELGIGLNYQIKQFTKDILFDEKIGGTIHLALGRSYPETGGKNQSAIHWDIIKELRKNGEIYLDGRKIFKNGKFLI